MALSKNTEEKITLDGLIETTEAEYKEDEKYFTITGKETTYNPQWDIYKSYDADVGDWVQGTPEVSIIEKDGKSYNALRIRIIDETTDEVLDCYCNFPKPDENGIIKGLNKDFDFYRNAFDFIYSVLRTKGEQYVVDKDGNEYNNFNKVDFIRFAKLVDTMNTVKIEITEGNEDSQYNSWMIKEME